MKRKLAAQAVWWSRSKRVGSEDRGGEERGTHEKRNGSPPTRYLPQAYFLTDSIFVFKERNGFLKGPFSLHGIYFFRTS